jgi:signal transduction histidine kinase
VTDREPTEPDRTTVQTDAAVFAGYRAWVIRFALVVSWAALGGLAYVGAAERGIDDSAVLGPVVVLGGCLIALTLLPWRRYLQRTQLGDGFILVWAALLVAGLVLVEDLRMDEPLVVAFLAVVVFVASVLSAPLTVILTALIAGAGYVVALRDSVDLAGGELALRITLFVLTALFTLFLAGGVRRQMEQAGRRVSEAREREGEISGKEAELDRLYAVSRTIGAGSNLSEVLPELVGRVVGAVHCKVGLVMLYRADDEVLEVMSPIWVAGHTLRAEGYQLPLTDGGIAQRVFTSSEPIVDNELSAHDGHDAFLRDLDVARIAAVPLQIESRGIGVLMVGDKAEGPFTPDDVDTLLSLAGPSALVLNQMLRYEEAKEAGEKMAELAQLKTDFVSVVSHELRTPLTSIIGALKTLTRPELAPPDPNARELVSSAANQANRLRTLIEDLLVVSRIDNRALPVRPESLHIKSLLSDLVASIPEADRRVLLDVGPDTSYLEADSEHLRRILTNLIVNALKYAPGSSIEVTARVSGAEVWLSVVDHGSGIPYELHDHIFDRFTQIESPDTRAKGGTGLGLSIVRGLAEAMGGRVWFEPTIGGGATFTVALPKSAGPIGLDTSRTVVG